MKSQHNLYVIAHDAVDPTHSILSFLRNSDIVLKWLADHAH